MPSREDIVYEARRLVNSPWRHQGRSPVTGLDCIGLIIAVAEALELPYKDHTDYTRQATGWDLRAEFDRQMEHRGVGDYRMGDVLLFREKAYPCHVAIVGHARGVFTLIHAVAKARKVIEEPLAHEWAEPGRVVACFAFKGVD